MRVDLCFFLLLALLAGIFTYPSDEYTPLPATSFTTQEQQAFEQSRRQVQNIAEPADIVAEIADSIPDLPDKQVRMPAISQTSAGDIESIILGHDLQEQGRADALTMPDLLLNLDALQQTWVVMVSMDPQNVEQAADITSTLQKQSIDAFFRSEACPAGIAATAISDRRECWTVLAGPYATRSEAALVSRDIAGILALDPATMDVWEWKVAP